MEGAVTNYLQESYRDGMKHEHAILSNGLCASEAAVYYFRELNHKRRKCDKSSTDVQRALNTIIKSLERHLGVDISRPQCKTSFDRHINIKLFATRQFQRKILPAIKAFLKEINMKTKGYTSKLKSVMNDINAIQFFG